MNVDPERVLSGKLSESSGYAGSDLYDYKVLFNALQNLVTTSFFLMFYGTIRSIIIDFNSHLLQSLVMIFSNTSYRKKFFFQCLLFYIFPFIFNPLYRCNVLCGIVILFDVFHDSGFFIRNLPSRLGKHISAGVLKAFLVWFGSGWASSNALVIITMVTLLVQIMKIMLDWIPPGSVLVG